MRTVFALLLAAPAAFAEQPRSDDPLGRIKAREVVEGVRSPEGLIEFMKTAHQESVKWGVRAAGSPLPLAGPSLVAAQSGAAWINLGPASATQSTDGPFVDSGRPNAILVDPRDANVIYLASAGGGVWKTYNALAAVTPTSGPPWSPMTESLGAMAVGGLALNPANPDSLVLGLGDPFDTHVPGIYHSDDGGATWSGAPAGGPVFLTNSLGTALQTRDIKFDPGGAIVMAATELGLFRSTDGGVSLSWTFVDPTPMPHTAQACWTLGFVGAHTWLLSSVDIAPAPGTVKGHLWRSIDDGMGWTEVTPASAATDIGRMSVAVSASDVATPNTARVYVLAQNGSYPGDQKDVFKSNDGGQTWTGLGMFAGSVNKPTNPTYNADGSNATNACLNNSHQCDLDVMHDQAWYNQLILVDPKNHDNLFVGGNLSMVRSLDGGTTWMVVADWLPAIGSFTQAGGAALPDSMYVHADYHAGAISYDSGGNPHVYMGTDGGIFQSTDALLAGVPHWESRLNRGLVTHLLFSVRTPTERTNNANCTVGAGNADVMWGGMQDNGTRYRMLGVDPTTFNDLTGGDGFGTGLGCVGAGTAVGSLLVATYVSIVQTEDTTAVSPQFVQATTGFPAGLDGSYTFNMKIGEDLTDANGQTFLTPLTTDCTVGAGCPNGLHGFIYGTTNGAANWSNVTGTVHINNTGGTETAIPYGLINVAVDPSHSGHWAAVSSFQAYATVNAGVDWYESAAVFAPNTYAAILSTVALDPADTTGNTIWVGSNSTDTNGTPIPASFGHLYKCTDLVTANCSAWSSVGTGTGLPNVPIEVIKFDPNDPNTIYVGTWTGLYRSIDHGANWTRHGIGMPLVKVTDLALAADGSSIRAGTYGRGYWEVHPVTGGSLHGVYGNGDFDNSGTIDGFDLVREAAILLTDSSSADYNEVGNLTGATNAIDSADFTQLIGKLGGRP